MMKITAIKLIAIDENTKITNLEKHVCQNVVAMATSSFRHSNLSYQIISTKILNEGASLAAFGLIFENLQTFKVSAGTFRLPDLDRVTAEH